jgi:hypothetical protein
MAVFLYENAFESALKKVAGSLMSFVEKLGIDAVQLSHTKREVAIGGLDQKMVVVGHEAIGVAQPIVALVYMLKGVEEVLAVLVVFEDGLLLVTTGGYMVDCTGVFYAKRTGHGVNIAEAIQNVNTKDLTLLFPIVPGLVSPLPLYKLIPRYHEQL